MRAAVVDRKWLVTSLRRCPRCQLLYRTPTTTEKENAAIYQKKYREGCTTELPSTAELAKLVTDNFRNSLYDYTGYLEVLAALGVEAGSTVYDFGCSWGYGTYQLAAAGYHVTGYEIGTDRARFAADKLGVRLRSPKQVEDSSLDVFFSAHVLEHVPSVEEALKTARRLLRPGGLFICFTPNGSLERRAADPDGWHRAWGFVHPQLLDRSWIEARLESGLVSDTAPYDIKAIAKGRSSDNWRGADLMFAFRNE
jgi:2-polyprenyl-3-methyl-5-hydroxy-6-metoxy-1,4-benzoquinol methylase